MTLDLAVQTVLLRTLDLFAQFMINAYVCCLPINDSLLRRLYFKDNEHGCNNLLLSVSVNNLLLNGFDEIFIEFCLHPLNPIFLFCYNDKMSNHFILKLIFNKC